MKQFLWSGAVLGGAVLASTGTASGQLYGISEFGSLYRISAIDASLTFIGTGVYNAAGPGSLEYNPTTGQLLTATIGFNTRLYSVSPTTGIAHSLGTTTLPFLSEGALEFADDGTLWGTNSGTSSANNHLFTMNPLTGAAMEGVLMQGPDRDINGLAWRSSDSMLIGLDRATMSLVVISPTTGAVSILAAVPAPSGGLGGMAAGATNGFYSTQSGELYSFRLSDGASTLIGNMGEPMYGLALVPSPGASLLFVMGALGARRNRRT